MRTNHVLPPGHAPRHTTDVLSFLRFVVACAIILTAAELGVPDNLFVDNPVEGDELQHMGEGCENDRLDDDSEVYVAEHTALTVGRRYVDVAFYDVDCVRDSGYAASIYRPPIAR